MKLVLKTVNQGQNFKLTKGEKLQLEARRGERYKIIDEDTGKTPPEIEVRREGDDLVMGLKNGDDTIAVIKDFWKNCDIQNKCYLVLDAPAQQGGELVGETIITQEGPVLDAILAGQIGTLESGVGAIYAEAGALAAAGMGAVAPAIIGLGAVGLAGLAVAASGGKKKDGAGDDHGMDGNGGDSGKDQDPTDNPDDSGNGSGGDPNNQGGTTNPPGGGTGGSTPTPTPTTGTPKPEIKDDGANYVVTPNKDAKDSDKTVIKYTDNDGNDHTITVTKNPDGTYSSDPADPAPASFDKTTGSVTIPKDNVNTSHDLTATTDDNDPSTTDDGTATISRTTTPAPQLDKSGNDVKVTPAKDAEAEDKTVITFKDKNGVEQKITVTKGDDGKYTAKGNPGAPVVFNEDDGSVTVPKDNIDISKPLVAETEDDDQPVHTENGKATYGEPTPAPTIKEVGDNYEVTPNPNAKDPMVVKYHDDKGDEKTIKVTKNPDGTYSSDPAVPAPATFDGATGKVTIPKDKVNPGNDLSATTDDGDDHTTNDGTATIPRTSTPDPVIDKTGDNVKVSPAKNVELEDKTVITFKDDKGTEQTITVIKKGENHFETEKTVPAPFQFNGTDGSVTIPKKSIDIKDKPLVAETVDDDKPVHTENGKATYGEPTPAPTIKEVGDNYEVTPNPNAKDPMVVKYHDDKGDEKTIKVTKNPDGTYSSDPAVPAPATFDGATGKVTIPKDKVNPGNDLSATTDDGDDYTTNDGTATIPRTSTPDPVIDKKGNDVKVTPAKNVELEDKTVITFKDDKGTEQTITVIKKGENHFETEKTVPAPFQFNGTDGTVTIPKKSIDIKDKPLVAETVDDDKPVHTENGKATYGEGTPAPTIKEVGDNYEVTPNPNAKDPMVVKYHDDKGDEKTIKVTKNPDGTYSSDPAVPAPATFDGATGKVTIPKDKVNPGNDLSATTDDGDDYTTNDGTATIPRTSTPDPVIDKKGDDVKVTPAKNVELEDKTVITFKDDKGTEQTITVIKKGENHFETEKTVPAPFQFDGTNGTVTIPKKSIDIKDKPLVAETVDDDKPVPTENGKATYGEGTPAPTIKEVGDNYEATPNPTAKDPMVVKYVDKNGDEQTIKVEKDGDKGWKKPGNVDDADFDSKTGTVKIPKDDVSRAHDITATTDDGDDATTNDGSDTIPRNKTPAPQIETDNGNVNVTPGKHLKDGDKTVITYQDPDGNDKEIVVIKDGGKFKAEPAPTSPLTFNADDGTVTIPKDSIGKDAPLVAETVDDDKPVPTENGIAKFGEPTPAPTIEPDGDNIVATPNPDSKDPMVVVYHDKDGNEQTLTVEKDGDNGWKKPAGVDDANFDKDTGAVTIPKDQIDPTHDVVAKTFDNNPDTKDGEAVYGKTESPAPDVKMETVGGTENLVVEKPADLGMIVNYVDDKGVTQTVNVTQNGTKWVADNSPAGFSIDENTGKVTIDPANVDFTKDVTAETIDNDDTLQNGFDKLDKTPMPTVDGKDANNATVTPPEKFEGGKVVVDFMLSDGNSAQITLTQSTPGAWTIDGNHPGVPDDYFASDGIRMDGNKLVIPKSFCDVSVPLTAKSVDADPETYDSVMTLPAGQTPMPEISRDTTTGDVVVKPADNSDVPVIVSYKKPDGSDGTVKITKDGKNWKASPMDPDWEFDPATGKLTIDKEDVSPTNDVVAKAVDGNPATEDSEAILGKAETAAPKLSRDASDNLVVEPAKGCDDSVVVEYRKEDGTLETITIKKVDNAGSTEWQADKLPKGAELSKTTGKLTIPASEASSAYEAKGTTVDGDNATTDNSTTLDRTRTPAPDVKYDGKTNDVTVTPAKDCEDSVQITFQNKDGAPVTITAKKTGGKWASDDIGEYGKVGETDGVITFDETKIDLDKLFEASTVDGTPKTPDGKDELDRTTPATVDGKDKNNVFVTPDPKGGKDDVVVEYTKADGTPGKVVIHHDGSKWTDSPDGPLPTGASIDPETGVLKLPKSLCDKSKPLSATTDDHNDETYNSVAWLPVGKTDAPKIERDPGTGDIKVTPADLDGASTVVEYVNSKGEKDSVTVKKVNGDLVVQDPDKHPDVAISSDKKSFVIPKSDASPAHDMKATTVDNDPTTDDASAELARNETPVPVIKRDADENLLVAPPKGTKEGDKVVIDYKKPDGTDGKIELTHDPKTNEWGASNLPEGSKFEPATGAINIPAKEADPSKEATATTVDNEPDTVTKDGTMTIDRVATSAPEVKAPGKDVVITPAKGSTDDIQVTFHDSEGNEKSFTAKHDGSGWKTEDADFTDWVNPDGTITIPAGKWNPDLEVKATSVDEDPENKTRNAEKVLEKTDKPVVSVDDNVHVAPQDPKSGDDIVVSYIDNNGNHVNVTISKGDDGKWSANKLPTGGAVDPATGEFTVPVSNCDPSKEFSATATDNDPSTYDSAVVVPPGATPAPSIERDNNTGAIKVTTNPKSEDDVVVSYRHPDGSEGSITIHKNGDSWEISKADPKVPGAKVETDGKNGVLTIPQNEINNGYETKAETEDNNPKTVNGQAVVHRTQTPAPDVKSMNDGEHVMVARAQDSDDAVKVTFTTNKGDAKEITISKNKEGVWNASEDLPEGCELTPTGDLKLSEKSVDFGKEVKAETQPKLQGEPAGSDTLDVTKPVVVDGTDADNVYVTIPKNSDVNVVEVEYKAKGATGTSKFNVSRDDSGTWSTTVGEVEAVPGDPDSVRLKLPKALCDTETALVATAKDKDADTWDSKSVLPRGSTGAPEIKWDDNHENVIVIPNAGEKNDVVVDYFDDEGNPHKITMHKEGADWTLKDAPEGAKFENGQLVIPGKHVSPAYDATATTVDGDPKTVDGKDTLNRTKTPAPSVKPVQDQDGNDVAVIITPAKNNDDKVVVKVTDKKTGDEKTFEAVKGADGNWTGNDVPDGAVVSKNGEIKLDPAKIDMNKDVTATTVDNDDPNPTEDGQKDLAKTKLPTHEHDADAGKSFITPNSTTKDSVEVKYTDKAGKEQTVVIKNENGSWTVDKAPAGVEVNEVSGKLTIPDSVRDTSQKITAKTVDGNNDTWDSILVAPPTSTPKPEISREGADIVVKPKDGSSTDVVIDYIDENGKPAKVKLKHEGGKWTADPASAGTMENETTGEFHIPQNKVDNTNNVTATAFDGNDETLDAVATLERNATPKPSFTTTDEGKKVVATPAEGSSDPLVVETWDVNNNPVKVTATKNDAGVWTAFDLPKGVELDPKTGALTFDGDRFNFNDADKKVTATAFDGKDETTDGSVELQRTAKPVVDAKDASNVTVKPAIGSTDPVVVTFTDADGKTPKSVKIVHNGGVWTADVNTPAPAGVDVDDDGTITIPKSICDVSEVLTARAVDGLDDTWDSTVVVPPATTKAPTIERDAAKDKVVVTPGDDNPVEVVYYDDAGNKKSVKMSKDGEGNWTVGSNPDGAEIVDGKLEIPNGKVSDAYTAVAKSLPETSSLNPASSELPREKTPAPSLEWEDGKLVAKPAQNCDDKVVVNYKDAGGNNDSVEITKQGDVWTNSKGIGGDDFDPKTGELKLDKTKVNPAYDSTAKTDDDGALPDTQVTAGRIATPAPIVTASEDNKHVTVKPVSDDPLVVTFFDKGGEPQTVKVEKNGSAWQVKGEKPDYVEVAADGTVTLPDANADFNLEVKGVAFDGKDNTVDGEATLQRTKAPKAAINKDTNAVEITPSGPDDTMMVIEYTDKDTHALKKFTVTKNDGKWGSNDKPSWANVDEDGKVVLPQDKYDSTEHVKATNVDGKDSTYDSSAYASATSNPAPTIERVGDNVVVTKPKGHLSDSLVVNFTDDEGNPVTLKVTKVDGAWKASPDVGATVDSDGNVSIPGNKVNPAYDAIATSVDGKPYTEDMPATLARTTTPAPDVRMEGDNVVVTPAKDTPDQLKVTYYEKGDDNEKTVLFSKDADGNWSQVGGDLPDDAVSVNSEGKVTLDGKKVDFTKEVKGYGFDNDDVKTPVDGEDHLEKTTAPEINGSGDNVTITPIDDNSVVASYHDLDGNIKEFTVSKTNGKWAGGKDLPKGVDVDPGTGEITIPKSQIDISKEVTGTTDDKDPTTYNASASYQGTLVVDYEVKFTGLEGKQAVVKYVNGADSVTYVNSNVDDMMITGAIRGSDDDLKRLEAKDLSIKFLNTSLTSDQIVLSNDIVNGARSFKIVPVDFDNNFVKDAEGNITGKNDGEFKVEVKLDADKFDEQVSRQLNSDDRETLQPQPYTLDTIIGDSSDNRVDATQTIRYQPTANLNNMIGDWGYQANPLDPTDTELVSNMLRVFDKAGLVAEPVWKDGKNPNELVITPKEDTVAKLKDYYSVTPENEKELEGFYNVPSDYSLFFDSVTAVGNDSKKDHPDQILVVKDNAGNEMDVTLKLKFFKPGASSMMANDENFWVNGREFANWRKTCSLDDLKEMGLTENQIKDIDKRAGEIINDKKNWWNGDEDYIGVHPNTKDWGQAPTNPKNLLALGGHSIYQDGYLPQDMTIKKTWDNGKKEWIEDKNKTEIPFPVVPTEGDDFVYVGLSRDYATQQVGAIGGLNKSGHVGSSYVSLGAGDDKFFVRGHVWQSVVFMGDGDDHAIVASVINNWGGWGLFDMGSGNDILEVRKGQGTAKFSLYNDARITMGEGDDILAIHSGIAYKDITYGTAYVSGGKGFDTLGFCGQSGYSDDVRKEQALTENIKGFEKIDLNIHVDAVKKPDGTPLRPDLIEDSPADRVALMEQDGKIARILTINHDQFLDYAQTLDANTYARQKAGVAPDHKILVIDGLEGFATVDLGEKDGKNNTTVNIGNEPRNAIYDSGHKVSLFKSEPQYWVNTGTETVGEKSYHVYQFMDYQGHLDNDQIWIQSTVTII